MARSTLVSAILLALPLTGLGAAPAVSAIDIARSFFDAANKADEGTILALFHPDAVLRILAMEFRGHAAIRDFLRRDVWGGRYSSIELHPITNGVESWVLFTPAGRGKPEPPIAYRMLTREGKIARLEGRYRKAGELPPRLEDELPFGLRRYLLGVRTGDLATVMDGFAAGAVVVDVGRRIEGNAAIREWTRREVLGLVYRLEALSTRLDSIVARFTITLPGGASFLADYDVKLDVSGRILVADLRYAE